MRTNKRNPRVYSGSINRRTFARTFAGAALGAGTLAHAPGKTEAAPFQFSIMLWTVFRQLPFEQRLEKVAEAGYHP
jgi:hydroxypyruvate isomerase